MLAPDSRAQEAGSVGAVKYGHAMTAGMFTPVDLWSLLRKPALIVYNKNMVLTIVIWGFLPVYEPPS